MLEAADFRKLNNGTTTDIKKIITAYPIGAYSADSCNADMLIDRGTAYFIKVGINSGRSAKYNKL